MSQDITPFNKHNKRLKLFTNYNVETNTIIGKDFKHSPFANHKVARIKDKEERAKLFAKNYILNGFNVTLAGYEVGLNKYVKTNRYGNLLRTKQWLKRYDFAVREEMLRMGNIVRFNGINEIDVINELSKIAFNETGNLTEGNNKGIKIKTDHKLKALDMLAKFLGLYEKDNAQKTAETQILQVAFVGEDRIESQEKHIKKTKNLKENSVWENKEVVDKLKEVENKLIQ